MNLILFELAEVHFVQPLWRSWRIPSNVLPPRHPSLLKSYIDIHFLHFILVRTWKHRLNERTDPQCTVDLVRFNNILLHARLISTMWKLCQTSFYTNPFKLALAVLQHQKLLFRRLVGLYNQSENSIHLSQSILSIFWFVFGIFVSGGSVISYLWCR